MRNDQVLNVNKQRTINVVEKCYDIHSEALVGERVHILEPTSALDEAPWHPLWRQAIKPTKLVWSFKSLGRDFCLSLPVWSHMDRAKCRRLVPGPPLRVPKGGFQLAFIRIPTNGRLTRGKHKIISPLLCRTGQCVVCSLTYGTILLQPSPFNTKCLLSAEWWWLDEAHTTTWGFKYLEFRWSNEVEKERWYSIGVICKVIKSGTLSRFWGEPFIVVTINTLCC